jgi:Cys-rich repeat protein
MPNDIAVCQATCSGGNTAQVCQSDAECPAGNVCRTGGAAPQGLTLCQPPLIPPGASAGTGTVTCGTMTCAAPNVCCSGGGGRFTCMALTACDASGSDSYTCTSQANCTAPSLCCVNFGQNQQNDVSDCQASCSGGNAAQVCLTNAECPTGMVCRAGGGAATGITICRAPAPVPDGGAGAPDAASDASPASDGATSSMDTGIPKPDASVDGSTLDGAGD